MEYYRLVLPERTYYPFFAVVWFCSWLPQLLFPPSNMMVEGISEPWPEPTRRTVQLQCCGCIRISSPGLLSWRRGLSHGQGRTLSLIPVPGSSWSSCTASQWITTILAACQNGHTLYLQSQAAFRNARGTMNNCIEKTMSSGLQLGRQSRWGRATSAWFRHLTLHHWHIPSMLVLLYMIFLHLHVQELQPAHQTLLNLTWS